MTKVLIVASQHGNELLGDHLYQYLAERPINGVQVEYYLANPKAHKANKRYIDTDMNRSYGEGESSYERIRARRLLAYINRYGYDLVLDCHTTTVHQDSCFIARDTKGKPAAFMRACHIKNVVVMEHEFVNQSLIGTCDKAVSVEISTQQLTEGLYDLLRTGLVNFASGRSPHATKVVFRVCDLLKKSELMPQDLQLRNFVKYRDYYPVLVGEEAYRRYTDYIGFKAKTRKTINV